MDRRRAKPQYRSSHIYTEPELPVYVTVLTEGSFLESPHAYEEPRHFDKTELRELTPHVEAFRSRWPNDLVIIIAEVTVPNGRWRAVPGNNIDKLYKDLKRQLYGLAGDRFPKHIISSVINKRLRQPYVPGEGDGVRGNAAWVLKYRGGTGVFPNHPRPSSAAAMGLLEETTWIGAWVGCRESVLKEVPGKRPLGEPPMAVIIFPRNERRAPYDHHHYANRMIDQYTGKVASTTHWWRCAREQPLFLFMDLYRMFSNFKTNIATADSDINDNMKKRSDTPGSETKEGLGTMQVTAPWPTSVAPLTTVSVAKFRRELKTYEIAQKSMERIAQYHVDDTKYNTPLNRVARDTQFQSSRLCDRLYDMGTELETSILQVEMLREQCMYLMDAEFNTVAARTDARLGILTILAFVLTPVGFVVSLFSVIDAGTTPLIVSTVLVAFFSVLVYVIVDGLHRSAEQKRLPTNLDVPEEDHIDGDEKRQRYR